MGQLSRFLRTTVDGYAHWCPACHQMHEFAIHRKNRCNAIWKWNGDPDCPTFAPSMNITAHDPEDNYREVCHYFLQEGKLIFLVDCTHEMRGQTIPLPELPPHMRDSHGQTIN